MIRSKHRVLKDRWQPALRFGFDAEAEHLDLAEMGPEEARDVIWPKIEERYKEKEVQLGVEALRNLERYIMLNIVDAQWKDHLLALDPLEGRHQLARLRPERLAGRVQAGILLPVPGDAQANRHRNNSISV